MILAGDIGGTKCNLGLFEKRGGKLQRVTHARYPSKDYAGLEDVVAEFVRGAKGKITTAGFGVAGVVVQDQVHATNLPWVVDGVALARLLRIDRVVLLNDMEAAGYGLAVLDSSELYPLNRGTPAPQANQALIAAGTGLGEAILFWDGSRHIVSAGEGGHADFAPRTEEEIELLRFLKKSYEQVSCELVLSGRGFREIHQFLAPERTHASFDNPEVDPAPEITHQAMSGTCPICVKTLDLWVSMYGAEAGNLALKALARGGVYVSGGIALKILDKLKAGSFLEAFCNKSKFRALLSQIPLQVVLNEETPVFGAAARAAANAV